LQGFHPYFFFAAGFLAAGFAAFFAGFAFAGICLLLNDISLFIYRYFILNYL